MTQLNLADTFLKEADYPRALSYAREALAGAQRMNNARLATGSGSKYGGATKSVTSVSIDSGRRNDAKA